MSSILRMGMIGGGIGAFIGPIHRRAAELDGGIRLIAGAFSRNAESSRQAGLGYGIDPDRAYPDYQTMLIEEAKRPDGIDFVSIVTPNDTHFPIASAAIGAGLPVLCDKPATISLDQARQLAELVAERRATYALAYTYTGYPMLREARALVRTGRIGTIRKLAVEYYQGWLANAAEQSGNKQAEWRTDPARSGPGGCIGDIGVHAFNLAEFVTGRRIVDLHAMLSTIVPGRLLDDDCTVLIRLDNGAPGTIAASQIATGERNGLRLRIWGDLGGLDWSHEQPDRLTLNRADGVTEILHAGSDGLDVQARESSRLPAGHPEGFLEALANIYADFAHALRGEARRQPSAMQGIAEGVRSMAFIETALASCRSGAWTPLSP